MVTRTEDPSGSRSAGEYLTDLQRWRFPPEADLRGSADHQRYTGWRRLALALAPERLVGPARTLVTRAMMRLGSPRALQSGSGPLRLHLACGERHIDGWVNVDMAGARTDLVWDLRRPLPVEPGSVHAIFHEHFLEHLPLEDAMESLRQCHRLLAPGGVLRIGVPDFRRHVLSYLDSDGFLEEIRPGRPTPLFALNELVYSYGHRSLWDLDSFRLVLEEVGFEDIRSTEFGESSLQPAPDSAERRNGTLYVEAFKPASST